MLDQMNDILNEREIWRIGWEGKDVKAIGVGEIFKCGLGNLGDVDWGVVLLPDKTTAAKVRLHACGDVLVQNSCIVQGSEGLPKNLPGKDAIGAYGQP